MPYIDEGARQDIDKRITMPSIPGELNYALTMMLKRYIDMNGESYRTYNDIIGALECCKLEIYRRKVAVYENGKIADNGDVW